MYVNCPPAAAWWRQELAWDVAASTGVPRERILALFRTGIWQSMLERIVSSITSLGQKSIRDGVVLFLLQEQARNPDSPFLQSTRVGKLMAALVAQSRWQAMGFFTARQVQEVIASEIAPRLRLD